MPLIPGARLGVYEIVGSLGAGGMGEVYRARDTTLGRDVALKILPESFATDPDRVMRFEREAKALASLNHPNIAAIYGIEGAGSSRALVMELVEGRDLSDVIAAGSEDPALRRPDGAPGLPPSQTLRRTAVASAEAGQPRGIPLDDALAIARQIAEALEAAHGQGIIHRDLKPANIKVKDDGTVKVLDFGLARVVPGSEDPGLRRDGDAALRTDGGPDLQVRADAPTMTSPAMTQMGLILGTAAYMSPEQAAGRPVDKRSDLWSFGVVLLEMLTGRRPFEGEMVSHVIASVLKDAPDFSALPPETPASIRTLLRRCLEKDRRKRLDSAGAARLEIDDAIAGVSDTPGASVAPATTAAPVWKRALPWTVAAVLAIVAVSTLVVAAPWKSTPTPMPRRLLADIGTDASLALFFGNAAALSPDGTTLVFVAEQGGTNRLFVRQLDQLEAVALPGTEGASAPFFSPDSRKVGFFAGVSLKSVFVTGGAALPIAEVGSLASSAGAWDADGTIFYAGLGGEVMQVPSGGGGTPKAFGTLSEGAGSQRTPQVLPGGAGVLCTEYFGSNDNANLVVIPRGGGTPKTVLEGGYFGRYLPGGYLVYMREGTLFGARFDLDSLSVEGESIPVLEDVLTNPIISTAHLAFSDDGTLVYIPSAGENLLRAIDWTTRDGITTPLRTDKVNWANPSFSPDGEKLAMDVSDGTQKDVWVYEWRRNRPTRVTFDQGNDVYPVWSPDGTQIVFASYGDAEFNGQLRIVNADGTGAPTAVAGQSGGQIPMSWKHDGTMLAVMEFATDTKSFDISMVAMTRGADQAWTAGQSTPFVDSQATDAVPQFSRDGRWVAYASDEEGVFNVYVKPFQAAGGPRKVSMNGTYPRWSKTADELLFLGPEGKVLSTRYSVEGGAFYADTPQPWTPTLTLRPGGEFSYDIHPDGERLALAAIEQKDVVRDHLVVMNNFFDYVKGVVDGKQ